MKARILWASARTIVLFTGATTLINPAFCRDFDDADQQFAQSRELLNAGDHDAALDALDDLRIRFPHNVDYSFARAQVLERQGRDDDALTELRAATALSPNYEDLWRLMFRILTRHSDPHIETELAALRRDAALRFPSATWWRDTDVDGPAIWTVLIGAGRESLSNGASPWAQQFIDISRERISSTRHHLRIGHDERFDTSDMSVAIGADYTLYSKWFVGFDLASANNSNFQPTTSYSAHVGHSFGSGLGIDLRYRRRTYDAATVSSVISTIEKYFGDFRIAYKIEQTHLSGAASSFGHAASFNWYRDEHTSFGLTLNDGSEAEAVGAGQILETNVRGMSINGRHALNDRFGAQWWIGVHEQGSFYRRTFGGVAISIRL